MINEKYLYQLDLALNLSFINQYFINIWTFLIFNLNINKLFLISFHPTKYFTCHGTIYLSFIFGIYINRVYSI